VNRVEYETERAKTAADRADQSRILLESARGLAGSLTRRAARETICASARELARGDFALLLEQEDDGDLVATASTGISLGALRIDAGGTASMTSGTGRFVEDAPSDPSILQHLVQETGVASAHFEPVHREDTVRGVLVIGWHDRIAPSALRDDLLGAMGAHAVIALERALLMEGLETAARTDELTGLPNRRGWDDEIARELARARRSGQPLCVAVIDLDHFKSVNDIHGHPAGDRLLKEAASAWRSTVRLTDVLARHGGEEFALALPACTLRDATILVERLRAATPGGQTVSAGIAQWDGLETAIQLYSRADGALYEAKRAGRDRVTLAA
jgi:diguanylate cyclase (GGDEF)-like protein